MLSNVSTLLPTCQACYLPRIFGDDRTADGHGRLAVKVLSSYLLMEQCNPAGKHAAQQIIRRIPYLVFKGSAIDLVSRRKFRPPSRGCNCHMFRILFVTNSVS